MFKTLFKPAFLGSLSAAQKNFFTKKNPHTNIRTTEQLYNRTIVAIVAIVAIVVDVAVVVFFSCLTREVQNSQRNNLIAPM